MLRAVTDRRGANGPMGCPEHLRNDILAKLRSRSPAFGAAHAPPAAADTTAETATSTVARPPTRDASSTVAPRTATSASSTVAQSTAATPASTVARRPRNTRSATSTPPQNFYGGPRGQHREDEHRATVIIPPELHTVAPEGAAGREPSSSPLTSTVALSTEQAEETAELSSGDDSFTAVLKRLLHLSLARTGTRFTNLYPTDFQVVTTQLLQAHLDGKIALAFAALEDGTSRGDALFGAVDVDRDFPRRLPVLRDAVHAVGGDAMLAAAFATTGSDEGRGKVIITLQRPMKAADVRLMMAAVKRAALADPRFGHMMASSEIELRPQSGSGGLLRVLGRNIGKDRTDFTAPLEIPMTLDGEYADLRGVMPLDVETIRQIADAHRAKNADRFAWVDNWLVQAWTYKAEEGNTRGIFRRMVALASAALERHGPDDGHRVFHAWCATVAANSPALDQPSPTNKDRRHPLRDQRTIARAWRYALARDRSWEPQDLVGSGLHASHVRLYHAVADYVYSRSLAPEFFSITYEFVTDELLGGGHKKTTWKQFQALVRHGLVVIHDTGLAMRRDAEGEYRKGLPTIMGLVGKGQTVDDVIAAVQSNSRHYARVAKRDRDRMALLQPKRRKTPALRAVG